MGGGIGGRFIGGIFIVWRCRCLLRGIIVVGVEVQLSESLVKRIEEFTPYKVEPKERAETILEGEIVSIAPSTLSLNPFTATPQEEEYTIIVNFTWKDLRTGKVLVQKINFEQATTYFPYLGEGQYIASQNSGSGEIGVGDRE